MRKMFSEAQIKAMGGISLYRHSLTVTGATGSLTLYTTSAEKFTSVLQIGQCINFEKFTNGIFLHGNFNGPTSLPAIVTFSGGNLVGPNFVGGQWTTVSLTSGAAVSDLVTKVL